MLNFLKSIFYQRPEASKVELFPIHSKPDNEKYVIVRGENLKNGDIIIHKGSRFKIENCGMGLGAGSFDFGVYISVDGHFTSSWNPYKRENFWLYKNSPIVKCISE